jgi:phosphoserine/homoserine phosphotransferase
VPVQVVCLDLEGVLVPEIWIEFSRRTGIADLSRTTRDEPDYDKLMHERIALLRRHGLKLADIQAVIDGMGPMDGAQAFLDGLRARFQVVILSDTFYEFADPLMRQLGRPTLLCHRLETDGEGFVTRHPPASIVAQFPQFPVTRSYAELGARIDEAARRLG